MTTKPGAPDPAFGRCQIARAGLSVRSLELNHLAHRIPPLDADCQPHTITLWVFSPRDDRHPPAVLPHMVAIVVQKAACTSETPEPTRTPSRQPNPSRMGFLRAGYFATLNVVHACEFMSRWRGCCQENSGCARK